AALLDDPAAVPKIRPTVAREVLRRDVEGLEPRLHARLLRRVDHDDVGGKTIEGGADARAVPVRAHLEPPAGRVDVPIRPQDVDDRRELRMERRLAAEQADALPRDAARDGLGDEAANLLERHPLRRGRLRARAIAVVAVEVAGPGDVDLEAPAMAPMARTEEPGRDPREA